MAKSFHHLTTAQLRQNRVRANMHGTAERPRLSVSRSNKHLSVQAIDDDAGVTIVGMSDKQLAKKKTTKTEAGKLLALALGKALIEKKIKKASFDRGKNAYLGRIRSFAESVREAGIKV
ncbi:MAG: 50S ribosomal protein L18 [Candidatus Pacebacteria bacterium CG_4_10_14_0_8_um_filter_42_14]|nr:MAG: 50S ribosomal protein L18 [Candidatus Pacebacteria bacterium CG_4_10_14_0_8_um_filter_42_14]